MKVQRFEDLRCWQAARELVKLVFLAAQTGPLSRDFSTRDQFKDAALSCMNNIAEGFGRFGVRDSIKFYDISQSSALEVKSMLYVFSDLEYLTQEKIAEIKLKAEEARSLTLAFIRYLRGSSSRKRKPKDGGREIEEADA